MSKIILHVCNGGVGLSWEQFVQALCITWVEQLYVLRLAGSPCHA
jgi:hypothetical protein